MDKELLEKALEAMYKEQMKQTQHLRSISINTSIVALLALLALIAVGYQLLSL